MATIFFTWTRPVTVQISDECHIVTIVSHGHHQWQFKTCRMLKKKVIAHGHHQCSSNFRCASQGDNRLTWTPPLTVQISDLCLRLLITSCADGPWQFKCQIHVTWWQVSYLDTAQRQFKFQMCHTVTIIFQCQSPVHHVRVCALLHLCITQKDVCSVGQLLIIFTNTEIVSVKVLQVRMQCSSWLQRPWAVGTRHSM